MAYDGSIRIDTKVDTGGFNSGLSKMKTLASKGAAAITASLAAVSAAVIGGGTAAVKVGSSFESAMDKVSAISGASGDDLIALTDKAKEMGASTKFSASESAEALQYMAMAGWQTEDMLDGISGIMSLAAADGLDLATTSDIVTDALTAFGLQSKDSSHFADVLAKASSSANTNVSMLGESFKYVAPLAGTMGYSVEDISVALGLMANASVKGSMAGTSLKTALANLSSPTKNMKEVMDKYGVSITDAQGNTLPLIDVIKDLRDKFGGLSESEQTAAASTLFGKEAMSGMLAIINASDSDFTKLVDNINNADGAAGSMAETMQDNLQGQITIFKSSLEGLGIELYGGLQEPLKNAAVEAQGYVNRLTDAFKDGNLSGMIEEAGNIFGDLAVKAAEYAPKLVDVAGKFIQSFVRGIDTNKNKLLESAKKIVTTTIKGVTSAAPKLINTAADLINDTASLLVKLAPKALEAGIQVVINLIKGVQKTAPNLLKQAAELIPQLAKTLISNAPKLLQAGIELFVSLAQAIPEAMKKLIPEIPKLIKEIGSMLKKGIPDLLKAAVELFKSLITGLWEVGTELIASIPDLLGSIVTSIGDAFTGVFRGIDEALSGVESTQTKYERLSEKQTELHEKRMEELSEEMQALDENQTSWDEMLEAQKRSIDEGLGEIGHYEDLITELQLLYDKNGEVKSGYEERVKFITDSLSEAFGIEIQSIDDIVGKNGELKDSIKSVIEEKKKQILLSAKEEAYAEAIKRQPELLKEAAKKQEEYNKKIQEAEENYSRADQLYKQAAEADAAHQDALAQKLYAEAALAEQMMNDAYEEADALEEAHGKIQDQLEDTIWAINDYETAYTKSADEISTLSREEVKSYKKTGDAKKAELEDQLKQQQEYSKTLLNLYRETGDESYLAQIKIANQRIEETKKELNEHNKATQSGMNDINNSVDAGEKKNVKTIEGKAEEYKKAEAGNAKAAADGMGDKQARDDAVAAAKAIADNGAQALYDANGNFTEAGRNAIQGFVNGLKNVEANTEATSLMGTLARTMVANLQKALDEHSPSKITEEIGRFFVEGLNVGVKKATSSAARQIISLGKEVTEQAEAMIGRNGDISETVTKQLKVGVEADGLVAKLRAGIADGKAMVTQALTAKVIHSVDVNTEEFNRKMILQGDVISHISIDGREFAVVSAPFVSEELQWNGGRA